MIVVVKVCEIVLRGFECETIFKKKVCKIL